MLFTLPAFRKPTTLLATAVAVFGLSVSDINFAQTPAPGAGLEPVPVETLPVENLEAAQTPDATPSQAATTDGTEAAPEDAVELPEPMGVSRQDALCLAKIIHHESANQPERVQLAVAHVVLNRLKSPTSVFPRSICGIALQRGQFFNVHAYNPQRDPRWATSQRIADRAIAGEGLSNAPGALFFHTAGAVSQISRSRRRVARLGGMDFYR